MVDMIQEMFDKGICVQQLIYDIRQNVYRIHFESSDDDDSESDSD